MPLTLFEFEYFEIVLDIMFIWTKLFSFYYILLIRFYWQENLKTNNFDNYYWK